MGSRTSIGDDRLPIYPVRVFRIDFGTKWFVRMLGQRYCGVMTHYVGKPPTGRSHYCPGADNGCTNHKLEVTWKGYVAAEVWDQPHNQWLPVALELTESLEVDIRATYARGQVWELSRALKAKRGPSPVRAVLNEQVPLNKLPPEFDILPVLQHLYHRTDLDIHMANPLPARVAAQPSIGDGPVALTPINRETLESRDEASEHWRRLRGKDHIDAKQHSKNGKEGKV